MLKCRSIVTSIAFLTLPALCGCGDKIDPIQSLNTSRFSGITVTYENDIKSIMTAYCLRCHSVSNQGADRNGAPADVNFDSYQDVTANAERASTKISAGTMPPGGGLPAEDRALFLAWIEDGMP